jgi:hypothetical protein
MEESMQSIKRCTFLLLLALAAVPAFAADLVSVSAHVTHPTANPGGFNEGRCTSAISSTPTFASG